MQEIERLAEEICLAASGRATVALQNEERRDMEGQEKNSRRGSKLFLFREATRSIRLLVGLVRDPFFKDLVLYGLVVVGKLVRRS
ncbi:hypothetical protein RRG08_026566 [Elysia crispata]|uniref:Uncharacterized protein n=1 Tax=Elysia crispata TaxID=231223 RepID=A0AAE0Y4Z0_9GAST|nr:hypothetical protein RRG08_026566 [Elysia crispata]